MYYLGCRYAHGGLGLPQDWVKELWYRAAELGHVESYNNIGYAYFRGRGVASNEIRASSYWGECRGKIQCWQDRGAGRKYCRALKHFMIAVEGGYNESLNAIKQMYSNGGM